MGGSGVVRDDRYGAAGRTSNRRLGWALFGVFATLSALSVVYIVIRSLSGHG